MYYETRSCYARRHNDLEVYSASFQVLFIVSLFCAWSITTVEINSGVHLLQSYIYRVSLFTSDGICLVILVLASSGLVNSGLGLGLVTLVLVLRIWSCLHH